MEIKTIAMVNAEGRRNVKLANGVRAQMMERLMTILADEGFEVAKAANGDVAIATCIDEVTGDTYYTRLAVSLSNKPLDAKVERKAKAKTEEPVAIPNLFDEE